MANDTYTENTISVIVPTFRREDALLQALQSIAVQSPVTLPIKLLVVDNNPLAQEKARVDSFAQTCPFAVDYIHCPKPGVSNARNAALAHVKSRYIAFLDDDMEASKTWIKRSLHTAQQFDAGVVFSPTYARMPDPQDRRNPYMAPFFSHTMAQTPEGVVQKTLGTGGTFIDLSKCDLPSPPFDPRLNQTGGEDDIFFDHLRRGGTRLSWSPRAETYEIVPKDRATDAYIWNRNFGYGQGPCRLSASRGGLKSLGVLRYMLTGTMQFAVYGPALAALRIINHPAYVTYMAKTARAMGKVYWAERFNPRVYASPKPQAQILA